MPYWDGDFARVLEALERGRYVVRYEVDGKAYGYVRSWHKHQRPNHREEASALPEPPVATPCPPCDDRAPTGQPPVHDTARGEGNGRERKGTEGSAAPTRGRPPPEPSSPEAVTEVRRIGSGGVARTLSLPSEQPPREYLDDAVMRGISREQAASTWEHYWGAGLPQGGVERLHDWLLKRAKERANAQARASPRSAGGTPPPKGKPAAQAIADWEAQEAELARQADIEMGRVPRGGAR